MKKSWMISIGVVAIVVGIGAAIWIPDYLEIRKARSLVSEELFDPTSPIYRNEVVASETMANGKKVLMVCGEVNAKNRMGAFVGFKQYTVAEGEFLGFHDVGKGPLYRSMCEDLKEMAK